MARRVRTIAVALLPAVVLVSMFVLERPAAATQGAPADETTTVTESLTPTPTPDPYLTITKVADAATVDAPNQVGFVITITHTGTTTSQNVTLTDPLPTTPGTSWSIDTAGSSGWTPACTIGSGPTLTCGPMDFDNSDTAIVHIVSATTTDTCDPAINDIENTATYTSGPIGTVLDTGSASDSTTVNCLPGVLMLTKVADKPTVSAGDEIGYTITASNTGGTSIGPVDVYDTPPTAMGLNWSIDSDPSSYCVLGDSPMCEIPSIAPGAHYSVHLTSPTTAAQCPNGVDNTAYAVVADIDIGNVNPDIPGLSAEAHINVLCPFLTLTKTSDLYRGVGGKKMSWTITVTNVGTGTAHNVVLTDSPLPPGGPWNTDDPTDCKPLDALVSITCTLGDLAPGGSVTIHVSGVLSSISDCGEIRNGAEVTADNNGEVTASTSSKVQCPNVSVVKTAEYGSVSHPTRGFAIVVSSTGTGAVKNVKLSDPLASGATWSITGGNGKSKCKIAKGALNCSFGTMKPKTSFTVHIKVVQKVCSKITNTATVSASNEPSFESGDNTSTADVGCAF